MSDGTATVYTDRSNPFQLTLVKNDVDLTELEMEAITKFELRYKNNLQAEGVYYDSTNFLDAFVRDNAAATVTIKPIDFGWDTSRKAGDLVEFLIYDTGDHTVGYVWTQFTLIVKGDAVVLI